MKKENECNYHPEVKIAYILGMVAVSMTALISGAFGSEGFKTIGVIIGFATVGLLFFGSLSFANGGY